MGILNFIIVVSLIITSCCSNTKTTSNNSNLTLDVQRLFYSPHVTKAKVAGIVRAGDTVKITGYDHAKQWFRVWYNNTSCYMTVNSISYRPW